MASPERWDIFCRVVDNYGDVGVAFRLGRRYFKKDMEAIDCEDQTVASSAAQPA